MAFQSMEVGDREMAQNLSELRALAEILDSVPSHPIVA